MATSMVIVDKDGWTPLHNAAQSSSDSAVFNVKQLIRKGADVKANDALFIIGELIQAGASVNVVDKDGRTPLHNATQASSHKAWYIIEQLIRAGADVNVVDKDGRTPLYNAVQSDSEEAKLEILLARHERFSSDGSSLWSGLRIYKECEGVLNDILTVSRVNSSDKFLAKSVSEILDECYPIYGLEILDWLRTACEQSVEIGCSSDNTASFGVESPVAQTKLHQPPQQFTRRQTDNLPVLADDSSAISPIRKTIVQGTKYCKIEGHLEADRLIWTATTTSEEFARKLTDALMWILFNLLIPIRIAGQSSSATSALPNFRKLLPQFHDATEGLEIDFNLLLELAAVDRKIDTDDGSIFFGFDTALIPLAPSESKRWHFLETPGRQIIPARVKRHFKGSRLRDKIGVDYTGTVYVGWCSDVVVKIGTENSDGISPNDISMISGACGVKEYEEAVGRSSTKDVSIFTRVGFSGSGIGATFGTKKDKKYKQGAVITKRTAKENFERVLDTADSTPCILCDESVHKSWLVSATSVLLLASLRYMKLKNCSLKSEQRDGQPQEAALPYVNSPTEKPSSSLRRNQTLLLSDDNGRTIKDIESFDMIVKEIWSEMSEGEDICCGENGRKKTKSGSILGYDISDVICARRKELKSVTVSACMKSWEPIALHEKTQIIFGSQFGQVLYCNWGSETTRCFTNNVEGTLSCLFTDLRTFYSKSHEPRLGISSLSIGDDHEWIPTGCIRSSLARHCSCCLQQVFPKKRQAETKLVKKDIRRHHQIGGTLSFASLQSMKSFAITFGNTEMVGSCLHAQGQA
ncbi:hypothetical protein BP5796_12540 [Coleophoma crateriformis]|uniref:Uncharacterized protein n=1 Tax=Coleophoma crateriformis TaxID=565419 RepID=A0A3D8Q7G2_9HELO|nr:hypothetical protein BP5796_12540 [Coleophoma crateriformis]